MMQLRYLLSIIYRENFVLKVEVARVSCCPVSRTHGCDWQHAWWSFGCFEFSQVLIGWESLTVVLLC